MFLVEMGEGELEGGMRDGYWVQAWTAWVSLHYLLALLHRQHSYLGSCKRDGEERTQGQNYTCFLDPWIHVVCGLLFVLSRQACFER